MIDQFVEILDPNYHPVLYHLVHVSLKCMTSLKLRMARLTPFMAISNGCIHVLNDNFHVISWQRNFSNLFKPKIGHCACYRENNLLFILPTFPQWKQTVYMLVCALMMKEITCMHSSCVQRNTKESPSGNSHKKNHLC